MKSCDLDEVSQQVRNYLAAVTADRQGRHPGVRLSRSRWRRRLLLGGLTWMCFSLAWRGLAPGSLYDSLPWQCLFAALAAVGTFSLARDLHLRCRREALGEFAYLDGSWLWEVDLRRLQVLDLRGSTSVRLVQDAGLIAPCVLEVKLRSGEALRIRVAGRRQTLEFGRFLSACQAVRQRAAAGLGPPEPGSAVRSAGAVSWLGRQILKLGKLPDAVDWASVIEVPDPSLLGEPARGHGPVFRRLALGVIVFAMGWLAFPPWRHHIDHQHHFDQVKAATGHEVNAHRAYLEKFPQGPQAEFVRSEMEDRLYALAAQRARERRSPGPLRAYLAGQPSGRHREEAVEGINGFYNEAIERLRSLGAGPGGGNGLTSGLLLILEQLKSRPSPHVSVRFSPKWKVLPDAGAMAESELRYQAAYAASDPVIRRLVQERGSAVLDLGATFAPDQVVRREAMILKQIADAVSGILSGDIISFIRVEAAEAADLAVAYDIQPSGTLRLYVRTDAERPGPAGQEAGTLVGAEATLGLVRDYEIRWKLRVLPEAVGRPFTYEVVSNPGTNLLYRAAFHDPPWAGYAVMMYSAFHDFSGRLLAGAGLTPPPAPTAFSFRDAVGTPTGTSGSSRVGK